ncbi:MAG: hypothetical protein QNJ88_09355 [Acidimicrobiia bacterium]|nr:hypothetical protein [Acidimicrobiia bacterium]
MEGLIFFGIFLIGGIVMFAVRAQKQRVAAAWNVAARQLGMDIHQGSTFSNPKITGRVDEMSIRVDTVTRNSGNNSQTFTRYRVKYPSPGVDFELQRQTGFSTITKFFGAQDVEIGDQRFDDAFVVKSDQPDMVAAAITPTRRTTLLQLTAAFPGIRIKDTQLQWEKRGVATNPDHIVTVVRRLIGAGFVISGIDGAERALDDAIAARNEGELGEAAERAREASGAFRELLEVRRMEAETAAEAGAPEAAELLAEVAVELPDDDEIRGWQERIAAPPKPAPAPAASTEPDPITADEISQELFGESRLSFETSRLFDEQFNGKIVRWSGPVKSAREYRRDSDLGEEPGTRAVVTVAQIENDLYGQTTVDAVVGLPPGTSNVLRGQTVTFQGTLTKVDAMMRNLFVTEAQVVG